MNPDDPLSWIVKGDRDLALARDMLPNLTTYPDLICYHCQQAAEKFLKSLIIHHRLPLRKTHDLEELLDMLTSVEASIDRSFYHEALKIKNYAVGIRYPDPSGDPTETDVAEALLSAEFFRNFAASILKI